MAINMSSGDMTVIFPNPTRTTLCKCVPGATDACYWANLTIDSWGAIRRYLSENHRLSWEEIGEIAHTSTGRPKVDFQNYEAVDFNSTDEVHGTVITTTGLTIYFRSSDRKAVDALKKNDTSLARLIKIMTANPSALSDVSWSYSIKAKRTKRDDSRAELARTCARTWSDLGLDFVINRVKSTDLYLESTSGEQSGMVNSARHAWSALQATPESRERGARETVNRVVRRGQRY